METSLTAIKILEQLPEPIKSEALAEAKKQKLETRFMECPSLQCALACCFVWSQSPQGYDYWSKIAINYSLILLNIQVV